MNTAIKKLRWLLVGVFFILISWGVNSLFYTPNLSAELATFQTEFNSLEEQQTEFLKALKSDISQKSIQKLWQSKSIQNSPFIVQIYQEGNLIYWNNNTLFLKKAEVPNKHHFVDRYSNGYYLVDNVKLSQLSIFVGSKIKDEYYYQNKALKNGATTHFSTSKDITIRSFSSKDAAKVTSLNGEILFYITFLSETDDNSTVQLFIFCFFVIGLLALIVSMTLYCIELAKKQKIVILIYPVLLLGLRGLSIRLGGLPFFKDYEIFDPVLYANSSITPNLGSFIISLVFIFVSVGWLLYFIQKIKEQTKLGIALLIIAYIGTLWYSEFITHSFESLIVNSTISLVINEVFSLTVFSVIALIIISFLFLSYYLIIRSISRKLLQSSMPLNKIALLWFVTGVAFSVVELFIYQHNLVHASWPILTNALFFYLATKGNAFQSAKYHITIVIVISFYGAIILSNNNQTNEHQKRKLYANQLVTDQDPTMEIEFQSTMEQITTSPEFIQLISQRKKLTRSQLSLQIEDCCFGEFWERYEMQFYLFATDGELAHKGVQQHSYSSEKLTSIIEQHSTPSVIAKDLYFVTDYYNQLSYISRQTIRIPSDSSLTFFILFKSKKIPEKIGFPRLLMNEKSYALQSLQDYSIARYSNGRLVMSFGNYNYPVSSTTFAIPSNQNSIFFSHNDMSHYFYQQDKGMAVIISKPTKQFIEQLSTFSYLFLFFGVFSLLVLILLNWSHLFPLKSLQLSFKVQTVLIGMVVGAFIIFIAIATRNVTHQFNVYALDNLSNKITAVNKEIHHYLSGYAQFNNELNGGEGDSYLMQLAAIFSTDINFYSPNGYLLATSQPKLYDKGITTRKMNSAAYFSLSFREKSEFIHQENLGKLTFLSGYTPYYTDSGELLGYINLQHFSQQNAFEKQMNEFIVAAINVAVLLLVISVLLAIIVSRWITQPLRLIQQNFRKVELGKENQPIDYTGKDEIGLLVKDYNDKLAELELKAIQLARSEREIAWREMAKQIAHEIKNPLTPMKLRVQHLQRSFQPDDPHSKEKIERVAASLIEQIDALTTIANEFSNFAKMPKANEERLNLIPLLHNIQELYTSKKVTITLSSESSQSIYLFADGKLLLRVFNNLIKNAIQATKEGEKTQIEITLEDKKDENAILIRIKDYGTGIPSPIQEKMFVPNFTTKTTGSGLGLAMVKQIILNHNGKISFQTKEGEWTIFTIQLPAVE